MATKYLTHVFDNDSQELADHLARYKNGEAIGSWRITNVITEAELPNLITNKETTKVILTLSDGNPDPAYSQADLPQS
jgi:hypothetical protein